MGALAEPAGGGVSGVAGGVFSATFAGSAARFLVLVATASSDEQDSKEDGTHRPPDYATNRPGALLLADGDGHIDPVAANRQGNRLARRGDHAVELRLRTDAPVYRVRG